MSKSRGNVVNPDAYFDRQGADTLRMYLVFIGPYERGGEWSDKGIGGIRRFLGRVWDLVMRHASRLETADLTSERALALDQVVRHVTADLDHMRYNTAIAVLMAYSNTLQSRETLHTWELTALLLMLAPFAPHITEELWARLSQAYSIHQEAFPTVSAEAIDQEVTRVVVQVNGRPRGTVSLARDADEAAAVEAALKVDAVRRALGDSLQPRVVYVPRRVLNLVTPIC
jgi:leucyl-tRNA synthetase